MNIIIYFCYNLTDRSEGFFIKKIQPTILYNKREIEVSIQFLNRRTNISNYREWLRRSSQMPLLHSLIISVHYLGWFKDYIM